MKSLTILLSIGLSFISLLFSTTLLAQCPFTSLTYGDLAAAPSSPGTSVLMSNCKFVGEYTTVTNVQAGGTYSVSMTGGTSDYITIYDNNFAPVAWGFSPVVFTAATSGTYYSIPFIGSSCVAFDPLFACNTETWNYISLATTQITTACADYTWSINNQTYFTSGGYLDSLANGSGGFDYFYLDLTIAIDSTALIVLQAGDSLTSQMAPGTFQWIDCTTNLFVSGATNQSFTPTQTGSYAVIISENGCVDTSACSFLMIPTYESITSCGVYTWAFNNQNYTSAGTYADSVPITGGFQVANLILTFAINPSDLVVVQSGNTLTSQSSLSNYQWIDCFTNLPISGATSQSFTPTQTGSYAVIISDSSCVDTSACTLVSVPIYNYVISCGDYTWAFNNQTYSSAGTYADSIQIPGGFQTAYLVLTNVITPADLGVIDSANVLISQSTSGNYQWIDCATNLPISGATNQFFEPTQSGSYAVIISDSSCVDTSACTVVQGVGLQEWNTSIFSIAPNPTNDFVSISFEGSQGYLLVTDLQGKRMLTDEVKSGDKIDLSQFDSGIYFFNMSVDNQNQILRVIRQ